VTAPTAALLFLAALAAAQSPAGLTIDYPEDDSIFPPDFAPPTFIWRDPQPAATIWQITIAFADGAAPIQLATRGESLKLGEVDPRCVALSNQIPRLTPRQAASHTWKPSEEVWAELCRQLRHHRHRRICDFRPRSTSLQRARHALHIRRPGRGTDLLPRRAAHAD
jgi:hypothetical protein